MKLGVISDTHGSLKGWEKGWEILKNSDVIIHCGDLFNHGPGNPVPEGYNPKELCNIFNNLSIPLLIVKGNCDSEVDQLFLKLPFSYPYLFVQFSELRILASHGHIFSDEEWEQIGEKWKINILISGHTHKWKLEKKSNIVILNPGSPSLPKCDEFTVAQIDTEERKVKVFNLDTKKVLVEESF